MYLFAYLLSRSVIYLTWLLIYLPIPPKFHAQLTKRMQTKVNVLPPGGPKSHKERRLWYPIPPISYYILNKVNDKKHVQTFCNCSHMFPQPTTSKDVMVSFSPFILVFPVSPLSFHFSSSSKTKRGGGTHNNI